MSGKRVGTEWWVGGVGWGVEDSYLKARSAFVRRPLSGVGYGWLPKDASTRICVSTVTTLTLSIILPPSSPPITKHHPSSTIMQG